ncbi:protein LDOC1-like [Ambystoma mexicanum]|uniref:protein LDOC1-like n=1 Tax=Ambystoma mexicanum TaxID=8296 RepID=UPI0037E93297
MDPVQELMQALSALRNDMASAHTTLHQRMDVLQSFIQPLPPDEEFGEAAAVADPPARQATPPAPTPVVLPGPFSLAPPERFMGDPKTYRTFVNQCRLHFLCRPLAFPDATTKAAFVLSHLGGTAAAWANPLLEADDPVLYNFEALIQAMNAVFDMRHKAQASDLEFLAITQGPAP